MQTSAISETPPPPPWQNADGEGEKKGKGDRAEGNAGAFLPSFLREVTADELTEEEGGGKKKKREDGRKRRKGRKVGKGGLAGLPTVRPSVHRLLLLST